MLNSWNLHWTLTVWGSALIEIQTAGSCPQKLWGCKNTARCEFKRHPLRGQRRLASFNLALLLIILMLSAFAKSSITAPNCQCRLLNSISSLTECMQAKTQPPSFTPGVEALNRAAMQMQNQTARAAFVCDHWNKKPTHAQGTPCEWMNIMSEVSCHEISMR